MVTDTWLSVYYIQRGHDDYNNDNDGNEWGKKKDFKIDFRKCERPFIP